jgi:hypothetical protein
MARHAVFVDQLALGGGVWRLVTVLTDGWEDPTALREKRPPRRYYELTNEGQLALGAVLQEACRDARFTDLRWRLT